MAKAKINRVHDAESGVSTFTMVESKELVECNSIVLLGPVGVVPTAEVLKRNAEYWSKLPLIVRRLVQHGINAKVGDSASDPKDGIKVMQTAWQGLVEGKWSQGGGRGASLDPLDVAIKTETIKQIQNRRGGTQLAAKEFFTNAESPEAAFRGACSKDIPRAKVTNLWERLIAGETAYVEDMAAVELRKAERAAAAMVPAKK